MATWTTPVTQATGDLITAATWNNEVVNNSTLIYGTRLTNAVDVANTITETDLLNGLVTIPANVGTSACIRLRAWGDRANNNATLQRLKLKLGSTTLLDTGVLNVIQAEGTARRDWRVEAVIMNCGAANSQLAHLIVVGTLNYTGNGSGTWNLPGGFVTGEGSNLAWGNGTSTSLSGRWEASGFNTTAVDTTVSNVLALTVTNPAANTSTDMKLVGALIEVY